MHRHALASEERNFECGAHCTAIVPVSDFFLVPQALLSAGEAERYVDALRTFTLDEASTHSGKNLGLVITKLIAPS